MRWRKWKKKTGRITPEIEKGIKILQSRDNIVIKPANKGGGEIVILDKSNYEAEMERLLLVENTYRTLTRNPMDKAMDKLKK